MSAYILHVFLDKLKVLSAQNLMFSPALCVLLMF